MQNDSGRSPSLATAPGVLFVPCAAIACALAPGCEQRRVDAGPAIAVVGESTRFRLEDPYPATSPQFDGARVSLAGARGELLGIQVLHRGVGEAVSLVVDGGRVMAYAVEILPVKRPSTAMYGGSRGAGMYADGLAPAVSPATNPAYFEIAIAADAAPGAHTGQLVVGGARFPVTLEVAAVTLSPLAPSVWAYEDPREFGSSDRAVAGSAERACIALFRAHGIVLSPDLDLAWWPTRKDLLAGFPHVPVVIPTDPTQVADAVHGWIEATRGTGQVPFAIPIDEPHTHDARLRVRDLAERARAAGGGPSTFRFAVTDAPHADYGDAVDLYISWKAAHLAGDRVARWTYNGAPPFAGSMVLDADTPGMRTWGWIGWRWKIPVWYVWDALYWHDRHNRKGAPPHALDLADPISFDDGEDRGNLDGVLALPAKAGCRPTLRMAALRRGLQDRALLDLAARCAPEATQKLAAELVPKALGDASGKAAWPADEAAWEAARRKLLALAACK